MKRDFVLAELELLSTRLAECSFVLDTFRSSVHTWYEADELKSDVVGEIDDLNAEATQLLRHLQKVCE